MASSPAAGERRASRGEKRESSFSRCSRQPGPEKPVQETSPVDRSAKQRPTVSPARLTAQRKLFLPSSSMASEMTVPGVMMRMISRSTRPLVVAGSSICSQMATL